MNIPIVSKFFAQRRTKELEYERQQAGNWSARTAAGIYITPDNALRNPTVWACHRYLTQTTAQLPFRIMRARRDGSGTNERVNGPISPVEYVLNWRANSELSPFQFKETMVGWAILWGNAYAEIEFDGAGHVTALWPLEPWRVKIMRENRQLFYRIDNEVDLPANSMFHLRGFGNGAVGLSVIEYAAQTIGWSQATEIFGATFFGEGLHIGGVVGLKNKSNPTALRQILDRLENRHKGVGRSNRWTVIDNDPTISKMSADPDEAQFVETLQFQVEQICRWFGVPPQKVQHLLRATFSNVEQQSIDVVGDAIAPWAMRFEEEATYKLFGQNRNNLFVKMDLKGLLRGDFQTRQTGLQIMRRNGIINANDWADLEDMSRPTSGGEKYIVEGNMTTSDKVGEEPLLPKPSQVDEPRDTSNQASGTLRLQRMQKQLASQRLLVNG